MSKQLLTIPTSTPLPKSSVKGYHHIAESVEANTRRSHTLRIILFMKKTFLLEVSSSQRNNDLE